MELCRDYRIPHSYFRGHGDGTWSDLDRRKARAYADYLKQVCPQCGTRSQEWDEHAGGDEEVVDPTAGDGDRLVDRAGRGGTLLEHGH